jgi:hypothetical protein
MLIRDYICVYTYTKYHKYTSTISRYAINSQTYPSVLQLKDTEYSEKHTINDQHIKIYYKYTQETSDMFNKRTHLSRFLLFLIGNFNALS